MGAIYGADVHKIYPGRDGTWKYTRSQQGGFREYCGAVQTNVPHTHKSKNTQKYTEYTQCNGFATVLYTQESLDKRV